MTFDGGPAQRPGRRNNQNLYEQVGDEPDHSVDRSIGWARDPAAVAVAVEAVNTGTPVKGARWWCAGDEHGALIYDRPGASLVSGWVIAVVSRSVADRNVAAVNGTKTAI